MNLRLIGAAAILCATFALIGCGGGGSGSNPNSNSNTAVLPYTGPAQLANFSWGRDSLQGAMLIGPAAGGVMQVHVLVRQQNPRGLISYGQEVSDPHSPAFRHFITPADIAARFGATQRDYEAAAQYFASQGLAVAGWPQRLSLSVTGPSQAMERAFGTQFGVYEKNGQQFVAPTGTPHFSASIPVSAVQNLVGIAIRHPYFIQVPPRASAGLNAGYSPQTLRAAFDFTGAYEKGFDGAGINIGIVGTGPISSADLPQLAALYHLSKVAAVQQINVTPQAVATGLPISKIQPGAPASPNPFVTPTPNINAFPYSNGFATPPPVTDPSSPPCVAKNPTLPSCNPEDIEAQLDTQQAATLAPGSNVLFYLAYNASDCYVFFPNSCATPAPVASASPPPGNYGTPQIGIVEADPEIEQAIADNSADVVSLSYGGGEPDTIGSGFDASGSGFEPLEFAALASEGIAVFASSGDNGSAECLAGSSSKISYQTKVCVGYPSGDPNVTSVGGVNAPLNELGQIVGNITAWGSFTTLGTSGSGGGTSTVFPAPPWQKNAIGATMREQPDVSMLGDPATGVTVEQNAAFADSAQILEVGGTSVAAPQMAAVWALVLQACKATPACATAGGAHPYRLGNAAPYLYAIYAGRNVGGPAGFVPTLPYANVFYDVVAGQNPMVNPSPGASPVPGAIAGTGYDQVTGIGVPFVGHLIQAVTGQAVP